VISTDPSLLDLELVHRWLSTDAYWALGRSRDVVERAVAGSESFGAYDGDRLVGYARVVSDRATFAWLCDVYVDAEHRGRGVGLALVEAVHDQLARWGVKRAMLATRDAHGVYARFGFEPIDGSGLYMTRGYEVH